MINIAESEAKIAALIEPQALALKYPETPLFKLKEFPGDLFALGKAITCNTVNIKFKDIEFEEATQFHQCCQGQINNVNWEILIINANLRTHRETYKIAESIIQELRGKYLLVNLDNALIQGQSPAQVTSYTFTNNTRGSKTSDSGQMSGCYASRIIISSKFTDKYDAESPIN